MVSPTASISPAKEAPPLISFVIVTLPQLSEDAVGSNSVPTTVYMLLPASVVLVSSAAQVTEGSIVSSTVTVALQVSELPAASCTVNVTVFAPMFAQLNTAGDTERLVTPVSSVEPPST